MQASYAHIMYATKCNKSLNFTIVCVLFFFFFGFHFRNQKKREFKVQGRMVRSKTMEHRKKDECQKLAKEIQNENQNKVITKKAKPTRLNIQHIPVLRTHKTQRSQIDL